jgi:hypothetical protein
MLRKGDDRPPTAHFWRAVAVIAGLLAIVAVALLWWLMIVAAASQE